MSDLRAKAIYVLPTEENLPPRAVLFDQSEVAMTPEGLAVNGTLATWSRDMGTWVIQDVPLPEELADAITEHAKSLGVEW